MTRTPLFILTALLGTASLSADLLEVPHVAVTGTAEREVAPDALVWNLVVETRGQVLEGVGQEHNLTAAKVLEFLKENGIDEEDLQTTGMRFAENWEYRSGSRHRNGFTATTRITATTQDLETYNPIWLGLSAIQGVSVNGVNFTLDDRKGLEKELKLEALRNARTEAEELADALDATIGAPLLISTDASRHRNVMERSAFAVESRGADASDSAVAPGMIMVQAQVSAVFELITAN